MEIHAEKKQVTFTSEVSILLNKTLFTQMSFQLIWHKTTISWVDFRTDSVNLDSSTNVSYNRQFQIW